MNKRIDDYKKVIKVIESCDTLLQLKVARMLMWRWFGMFKIYYKDENIDYLLFLYDTIEKQKRLFDIYDKKKQVLYYHTAMKSGAWCNHV